ncbi:hypothetical protein EC80569_0336, partial [Escherichia coli 8.0569]
LSGLRRALNS